MRRLVILALRTLLALLSPSASRFAATDVAAPAGTKPYIPHNAVTMVQQQNLNSFKFDKFYSISKYPRKSYPFKTPYQAVILEKAMSMQEKTPSRRSYHSPRRQEQANHTRKRIIEAAIRQLKEKGYANMSLDSIAREAGVASQTVYAVCGSKKGVLARILESTVAEEKYDKIRDSIPQMKTGDERVETMARFHSLMQHNSASGFELMRGVGVISPELAELEKDNDLMLHEKSLQSIRQMADNGMLKKGLSVEEATDLYWAYTAPGIYRRLVLVRGWSMEKYMKQMSAMLKFLLLDENEKDGEQKKENETDSN